MRQCPPPVHQRTDPSGGQPRTPRTGRSACSQHEYGERIKMVAVADASSQAGIKGRGQWTMQRPGDRSRLWRIAMLRCPRGYSFRTSPGPSVGGAWRNPGRSTVLRQRVPMSLASVLLAGDRRTVGFTPPESPAIRSAAGLSPFHAECIRTGRGERGHRNLSNAPATVGSSQATGQPRWPHPPRSGV